MKMTSRNRPWALFSLTAVLSALSIQAASLQDEAQQAIASFQKTDPSLVTFFTNSAGYAVFPNVGKGGFVVGGARGEGIVYEKSNIIGQAMMTQASIGAQIGGQTFSEVIFFENPAALNDFKFGKFELSADVSAVVAAEGASKAAKYKQGVAVFTLPKKGVMLQASVGGQKFKFVPLTVQPTGRPDVTSGQAEK